MITWFQVWPLLAIPYFLFYAVGLFPFIREGMLNHLLIPLLPYNTALILVDWYQQASLVEEYLLQFLISINLGTIIYPLLYAIGALYIKVNNGISRSQIKSLNLK